MAGKVEVVKAEVRGRTCGFEERRIGRKRETKWKWGEPG